MKYYYGIWLTLLLAGCTNNFESDNIDKKNPARVSAASLFSSGQKYLADQVNTAASRRNIFKMYAQYWSQTTYQQAANYDLTYQPVTRNIFSEYYRQAMRDWQQCAKLLPEEPNHSTELKNKLAIVELLTVYAFQQLVDIFGMVPYTDAMNVYNLYPRYDPGLTIYKDLLKRIDAALSNLTEDAGSFGAADLFYGGRVKSWIKFGHTLKVKVGISMADAVGESALSRSAVESSYAGAFSSSADDCKMLYQEGAPNFNPVYGELVATGRKDYVVANTIVDIMNDLQDPRRSQFFTPLPDGKYLGGQYGYSASYPDYSHVNDKILDPKFPGPMMTYTELLFYLAEAAARGYSVGKSAAEYYTLGIQNSILEWGGTRAEADQYLAQSSVDYATARDRSKDGWREKIATQAWIANYTKGLEAWTTWRRLDYPVLNVPKKKKTVHDIPKRLMFPADEQTVNAVNYNAAAKAVGGDEVTTKIFWDIYEANKN